jgi:hypothetical protein
MKEAAGNWQGIISTKKAKSGGCPGVPCVIGELQKDPFRAITKDI